MWAFDSIIQNSYCLYKRWKEMHNLKPISHYDCRESICLSWLDSEKYWPLRFKKFPNRITRPIMAPMSPGYSSCISTMIGCVSFASPLPPTKVAFKQASKITDDIIKNKDYNIKRLTITAQYNHLPELVTNQSEFQLHKWCYKDHKDPKLGRVKRRRLCFCQTCNVVLCLPCYSIFHKIHDLNTIKKNLT